MRLILAGWLMIVPFFTTSCAKKEIEPAPPPPSPNTFAFTDTSTTIAASEIDTADNAKRSLKADFNLDGLSDLAVIKAEGEIQNKVEIYIQKARKSGSDAANPEPTFFRGGTIERPNDGKIIGLASKVDKEMADIILLITYSSSPNKFIHYRNDGKSFTEVQD